MAKTGRDRQASSSPSPTGPNQSKKAPAATPPRTEPDIPYELLEKIARRRCILFIGAGLSKATHELPLWDELITTIYDSLNRGRRLTFSPEQAREHRLEFLEWSYKRYRAAFNSELLTCLRLQPDQIASLESSDVHRMLVKLPWAAIVTSNFDTLIERAFEDERLPYVLVERETDLPKAALGEGTVILKLHGTAGDEEERVLTASEYRRFRVSRQSVSAEFVALLSKYPMLMVGAGVSDPNFQNLYDIADSALGGFKHPCYYLTDPLPEFLRDVWKARGFEYQELPNYDLVSYQKWVIRLSDGVKQIIDDDPTWRSRTNATWFAKDATLKVMQASIANYAETHRIYTQAIHSPDCAAFHESWERTLYKPVRTLVLRLAPRNKFHLMYVGPGPHIPLLDGERGRVAQRVSRATLVDIDDRVLVAASRAARSLKVPEIQTEGYDITEGAGDRLAARLSSAAQAEPHQILERLHEIEREIRDLFPSRTAKARPARQQVDLAVSEMVASFTAIPPLMAFRSRIETSTNDLLPKDRTKIEKVLGEICTSFNESAFRRHLSWLSRQVRIGGRIIIVADTAKVFPGDQGERPAFANGKFPSPRQSAIRELDIDRSDREFYWLDHPFPLIPEGAGILSDEFRPHSHRILVAAYQVTG